MTAKLTLVLPASALPENTVAPKTAALMTERLNSIWLRPFTQKH
ncbi:hypothetical protein [uncultured Abyssibacter sp.]